MPLESGKKKGFILLGYAESKTRASKVYAICYRHGTLIDHTLGICGGRPRIADIRISVQRIAAWYKMELNAEEIVERMSTLALA